MTTLKPDFVFCVTASREPSPRQGVCLWLRGGDPWHADAFVGTPLEGKWIDPEPQKQGWLGFDKWGACKYFVPDGTPVDAAVPPAFPKPKKNQVQNSQVRHASNAYPQ